jgi:putative hydrolase of the HAD superfamily
VRAAIFDLGGVVLESPMGAIADFEARRGIPAGTVNRVVVESGDSGAWARHERGEVERASFLPAFASEFAHRGFSVDVGALMDEVDASIRVRPRMLRAVGKLRSRGIAVAALTNNWTPFDPDGVPRHFDVTVESVIEGTRKPERRIYEICVDRLGVEPSDCVMFDDLGPNLKTARELGMVTVKVTSAGQALTEIDRIFG